MKSFTFLICILLSLSLFTCINNKIPVQGDDDNSKIIHPDGKKRTVTVYGYSYVRGRSKIGVERFAINQSRVSIGEQARGTGFTLEVKSNKTVFATDTGVVTMSGIELVSKQVKQTDGLWEMYVVHKAEIEVVIPGDKEVIIKDVHGEDTDLSSLLSKLQAQAITDSVKEHSDLRASGKITGHLYMSFLEVTPLPDAPGVSADVRFFIIFD
ncbi:MAG: hypothetical protein JXJ04_17625 [Spirochaetales bacterium]|nr:hypothetical protein [Spirochaetales bacterium]